MFVFISSAGKNIGLLQITRSLGYVIPCISSLDSYIALIMGFYGYYRIAMLAGINVP